MPRPTPTPRSEQIDPLSAPIAAEVRLLLMLCRYPVDHIVREEALKLCAEVTDWDRFLLLARHHRVMPLIARNLAGTTASLDLPLPTTVMQPLRAYAATNAVEAFRFLAETQKLLASLMTAGIDATVLKGVPLSFMAFGDVATRDVGDIDLLIQPEQAEAADLVLQQHGFFRREPPGRLTPKRRASYARHFKDYTYEPLSMQSKGGFEVDLHWRLFRNPQMPGNDLTEHDRQTISTGSMQIATLAPAVQLSYLAVQGAVDGWTRFKAVADVAAMWNVSDKAEVLELARENGVLPYLFAALTLADGWIGGLELPEGFNLEKHQHPLSKKIVAQAREKMQATFYLPPLRDTSSWSVKRYEASLHGTSEYKWEIVRRVMFRPRVWNRFDLPDALFPLYSLLSPVEWLLFHLGKRQESKS